MIKTNSDRVIEAAAAYIESLCDEGKNSVLVQTFSGEFCQGTIRQQEIQRYNPLKVFLTLIDRNTKTEQTFDLGDVALIQPIV